MIERIYTIPLRRGWLKAPKWRRSKKAISAIQVFLEKHTKVQDIKLRKWVNEELCANAGKSSHRKITLKVNIDKDKGVARAELVELPKAAKRLAEANKKQEAKAKKVEAKNPKEEVLEEPQEEKKGEKMPATMTKEQEMAMHKK